MTTRPSPATHPVSTQELSSEIYRVVLEREGRVSPPPGFVLPELAAVVPGVVTEIGTRSRRSVYFDTVDLALADRGITVRRDRDAGRYDWRLVITTESTAAFPIRRRLHFSGDTETVPRELLVYLMRHHDRHGLVPVASVSARADVVTLLTPSGIRLAEVFDECAHVLGAATSTAAHRQIAVTTRVLNLIGADVVYAVVVRLQQAGCRLELPTGDAYRFTGR